MRFSRIPLSSNLLFSPSSLSVSSPPRHDDPDDDDACVERKSDTQRETVMFPNNYSRFLSVSVSRLPSVSHFTSPFLSFPPVAHTAHSLQHAHIRYTYCLVGVHCHEEDLPVFSLSAFLTAVKHIHTRSLHVLHGCMDFSYNTCILLYQICVYHDIHDDDNTCTHACPLLSFVFSSPLFSFTHTVDPWIKGIFTETSWCLCAEDRQQRPSLLSPS